MEGPRSPEAHEFNSVVDFLNAQLRQNQSWAIASEYPTALATSNIHNMSIITDDEKIISHAVLKTLIVKTPVAILKVGAIGSVVTDPDYRQKGFSRKNIENCIRLAQEQDCDIVVLWTDQFDFYRKFGFELAGYEYSFSLDDQTKRATSTGLRFVSGNNVDPQALLKLYTQHTVHALRTAEDFRQFLKIPNSHAYTAWNQNNQIVAYAVEGKGVDLINYVHEWAGQTDALLELFQFIQTEKKEPITIMLPAHSINLRQKMQQATNFTHQGYLGMIKLINKNQLLNKVKKAFRAEGFENVVLEMQESNFVFGFGTDLYTLQSESDLILLLFGPLEIQSLDFMSSDAKNKFSQLLPLPIWIWGWDSI